MQSMRSHMIHHTHATPLTRKRVHILHARVFRTLQLLNAGNFCVRDTLSMDSDSVQAAWAL
jgi:hypothetical protein